MPTVVDSLVIELELNPAEFSQGARKAVGDLRKLEKAGAHTGGSLQDSGKLAGEFFAPMRREALGLFAILTAGRGIKALISDTIGGTAAATRFAGVLGMTTKQLTGLQNAAKVAGGSGAGVASLLEGIITRFQTPQERPGLFNIARQLGVQLTDSNGQLLNSVDLVKRLQKAFYELHKTNPGRALVLGHAIGADDSTLAWLEQNPKVFDPQLDKAMRSAATDKQGETMEQTVAETRQLQQQVEAAARAAATQGAPAANKAMSSLSDWWDKHQDYLNDHTGDALGAITAAMAGKGVAGAGLKLGQKLAGSLLGRGGNAAGTAAMDVAATGLDASAEALTASAASLEAAAVSLRGGSAAGAAGSGAASAAEGGAAGAAEKKGASAAERAAAKVAPTVAAAIFSGAATAGLTITGALASAGALLFGGYKAGQDASKNAAQAEKEGRPLVGTDMNGLPIYGPKPSTPPLATPADVASFRPMLEMLGKSEGTSKARGYNETVGYGAYTGGPVDLTDMTLAQVAKLQKKMLANPANTVDSSAVGMYQFISSTLKRLSAQLHLDPSKTKFTPAIQDLLATQDLINQGGREALKGQLPAPKFQYRVSKEWASVADPYKGRSHYGQATGVGTHDFLEVLKRERELAVRTASTDRRFNEVLTQLRQSPLHTAQVTNNHHQTEVTVNVATKATDPKGVGREVGNALRSPRGVAARANMGLV